MVLKSPRPQRRHHTKSRGGCIECKKRHIKCGEEKPDCRSCVIRNIDCAYNLHYNSSTKARATSLLERTQQPSPEIKLQTSPSSPSDDSSVAFTPDLSQYRHVAGEFGQQDLCLVHHWTLYTSRSICDCWSIESHCSVDMFQLGLDHLFVMHGILSIASLHLAFLEPFDKQKQLETAVMHHNLALEQVRRLSAECIETSGDALRVFSTVNLVYTLAISGPLAGLTGNVPKDSQPISPHWIHQFRDVAPKIDIWHYPTPIDEMDVTMDFVAEDDYLVHIRRAYRDNHTSDIELYDSVLQLLRRCYNHTSGPRSNHVDNPTVCDLDRWNGPINFLYHLPEEYIEKLHQRQPPALIIFSFFGAILSLQDEPWFIRGWARSIVTAVDGILGGYWEPYTEWCREIVALRPIEAEE